MFKKIELLNFVFYIEPLNYSACIRARYNFDAPLRNILYVYYLCNSFGEFGVYILRCALKFKPSTKF